MRVITCVEDLRRLHKKRAPKAFYDYVDCGSYTEDTYRANSADLAALKLRQRVAIDTEGRSTESTMLGRKVTMPIALAPVGLTGMQWADGEILAARAAERFGVPFTLSTMSICSIEDVAERTTEPFWFQLYVMRDRDFIKRLIGRAKAAKCSALVLTLDLQIIGQRHKDLKNGMTVPPKIMLSNVLDLMTKPGWAFRMLGDKHEVWMDGGIRSGQDLFKALALGAKGTLIGRAFSFGLGAMGEAGVTTALEIIRKELDTTMALTGVRTIGEIGRRLVLNPY